MDQRIFTYMALLRGINVGGNSIIKMGDLAKTFKRLKFLDVHTYIQSGNVVFKTSIQDARRLESFIEKEITKEYSLSPKVLIRSLKEMQKLVRNIPKHWDSPDKKYNVIFLRHSIDSKKILDELNPKTDIEEVVYRPGVLFWSANTSDLSRTTMIKLSSKEIYQEMTVRNLNTTRKILDLMKATER